MNQIFNLLFEQYSSYAVLDIIMEITAVFFGFASVWYSKQNKIFNISGFTMNLPSIQNVEYDTDFVKTVLTDGGKNSIARLVDITSLTYDSTAKTFTLVAPT